MTRYSCSIVVAPAVGGQQQLLALDLLRARQREQRVQLGPLRRYPLLVSVQPHLRILPQMHDLAGDELRQQRLPLARRGVLGRLARKRGVALQEALGQVEQRLPELVLDLRAAAGVLDVLPGQGPAQRPRLRVGVEHRFEARRRAPGVALGMAAQFGHQLAVDGERVVRREQGEPALDRPAVGERVLARPAESEHPVLVSWARRLPHRSAAGGRAIHGAALPRHATIAPRRIRRRENKGSPTGLPVPSPFDDRAKRHPRQARTPRVARIVQRTFRAAQRARTAHRERFRAARSPVCSSRGWTCAAQNE